MKEWTHLDVLRDKLGGSLVGYAVYDALGVRLGYVSGWVVDGDEQIQMLKISVTQWADSTEYLVPTGAITLIDDSKKRVQLRGLTKESIGRLCFQLTGDLPERRLLVSLNRHFPPARASVVERLSRVAEESKSSQDGLTWIRLSEIASSPS